MKCYVILLCLCFIRVSYGSGNSLKDPYICGPPKCAVSEKFNYLIEEIYYYDYKVNVETYYAGSSNNRSTFDVKAQAAVQFVTQCEGLLTLSNVILVDQDLNYPVERAEKFIHALSLFELRFAFHDGVISEVCPEDNEEEWVLNFKRGLLALFQNTMKRFDINVKGVEQDIHGTCDVDYVVRGQENTSLILVKTRDLSQCTNRYKYLSILQTVRYDFQSKFQTWPVLKSESKCRITVDHKIYKAVTCRERHLFEPFSGRNSGVMTTVIQDLVLTKELNKTDIEFMEAQPKTWSVIQRRENLLQNHIGPIKGEENAELKSARDILKLICKSKESADNGRVDENLDSGSTVTLWGRLVRSARGLHHVALSQLLTRANTICDRATKHILDALPYIASPGSVELIKDMIVKREIDNDTRHEWLMSVAMIPRPKTEMLISLLQLLQNEVNDKVVSFTVSSVLHSYCKHSGKTSRQCCEEEIPKKIAEEFEKVANGILKKGIFNCDRIEKDNLVIAIKALGNIGGFKQEFSDILLNLIGDTLIPVPIRLTAIDAFRRTPCDETREYFLETFREDYVNIEIRIASYLQVMRCPNLSTVRKIFHALRNEPVNQAATFVWSHLNNLGESSLPSRVEIQGLLSGNKMPQLEDSPDFRMFSRNYEQSVFFDQYNAGGNFETNLIFSPDSYIPRSLSLNFTVDMFGESINILELKGRIEGFERYFEQIFGNNGPFSKTKLNDEIQKLRFLRSTNEAEEMREKIDDLNYKNEALKHQFPLAELGIKIFGNEISFWSAEGDDEIKKTLARMNPQLRVLEILSGKEISYNKASLFLDTTFSVPTGSGFPLNLNLMGTSYVDIKMSGALQDNFRKSKHLEFEGKIHPSVALNIAATMGVVAGGLSSCGARLNTRLYSGGAVAAKLSLDTLAHASLQLELPNDLNEIFAAKSELIILHGDTEHQQQGLNKNRIEQNTCSWSTFDKAIGIKVCAAYQFPNMTNLSNAPYFLLSGPAKYVLSLEKADLSAKTYAIEYKWNNNETNNDISFSFDTPNSKEKRMFNAVVSLSNTSSTASIKFQSAENTLQANGHYKNLETDKSIEANLDIDGKKHFGTLMSLQRHEIQHGFVWIPYAYWLVNDERIAEVSGSLKLKAKGGVTQWDITTDFQTKQVASRLIGYYTINGPTHGVKLQLDYQFYKNAKQTVKMEGSYRERTLGFRHDIIGDLEMDFTAYPAYNFYTVLKNLRAVNHIDVSFNVSSSKALKDDPNLIFYFRRIDNFDVVKFDNLVSLKRPKPIKIQLQYKKTGPTHTALALLNFNPESRDIMFSGNLFYPPGTQLYMDGDVNITLPTLHPCSIKAKVHERETNEFQVNAFGVWFTGMDFNIDALYQDKSKTNLMSHRAKVLINSSHFKDIAIDGRFTQDNRQITFVGQGEYNDDKYQTLIRYVLLSEQNFTTYAELDISGKVYSFNINADLNNNTNVIVDAHFDQLRDIQILYQRWVSLQQKRMSVALNWDANRDPTQKVSIDVQLDNMGALHHGGHVTLYYPGRMVNGEFEFLLKDWFCQWHVRMGWSNEANILWQVKLYSDAKDETVYALLSTMTTPFQGWKDTSFNLMWRYHDNLQALNGSMNWEKDYLAFSLLADYLFKTNEFFGEINALVNSTIPTLPKAAAIAKHRVIWKKSADTLLSFQYNEEGMLMINSSWILDKGRNENNVSGVITLITPFQGYKHGFLKTKFVFGHKKDINGITFLKLEEKILKINVNGHMRRITNCMLIMNVTSPLSDKSLVTARFGFVESDRHLAAIVTTANSTTGLEVILKLSSLQDFHIFGHVALPIQYLNRATVTAKRGLEELDFRLGWGKMDFGFTGIWHYQSPVNFVYLYKLYTPLDGFEENGLVLKNVYGDGLDMELSMRLSKHKFGIAILLVDNGKGLIDVVNDIVQHKNKPITDTIVDNFDTTANVILDTLYYPTVTFHSHLMKFVGPNEEDIIELNATLNLPNKTPIVLTDVFILEEFTVMRNKLNLVTPFPALKEVKSVYTVDIVLNEKINVTCLIMLSNGTYWNEISYRIYYETESGEDDAYESYLASIGIITPLSVLPALDASTSVRFEDALWKLHADISMPAFTINADGRLELDDTFVETSGSLNMTSDYLDDYCILMEFKKDFSDIENAIGGGIRVQQGDQDNYLFADVVWRPPPTRHIRFKSRGALIPVLPASTLALIYSEEDKQRTLTVDLTNDENYYSLKADQRPTTINVALSSPHDGYRAMKLISEFENDDVQGSFVSDNFEYGITGKIVSREPLEVSLTLTPKGQGEPFSVRIKGDANATVYGLSAHFAGPIQATFRTKAVLESNFTDLSLKLEIPQSRNKEFNFKARADSHTELRKVVSVQAETPFPKLKYIKGDTDFVFGPKTGYLLCKYALPDMKGDGDLKWSFLIGDLYIKAIGNQLAKQVQRNVDLDIYFGNSTANDGLLKTDAGFRMDLDTIWQIGGNATFGYIFNGQMPSRIHMVINAILPKPNVDVHTLYIDGDIGFTNPIVKTLEAEYRTDVTKIITGIKGNVIDIPEDIKANATVTWTSTEGHKFLDNFLIYRWDVNDSKHIDYTLRSPLYDTDDTFKVKGSFQKDMVHGYQIVKGLIHHPGKQQIGEVDLRYGGFKHTDGHFNLTTPFAKLPWLKSIFDLNNFEEQSDNKLDLFWPNNTATVNTTHVYKKSSDGFTQDGVVSLSVPLNTQHLVNTKYHFVQGNKWSDGNATVDLDSERFVKASFKQVLSKSERNLDYATTDIEVENQHIPVGVKYIHEHDETGNTDVKQATVFHLHNATKFNVTGKMDVHTYNIGKDLKLMAIHGNRTLMFENKYEAVDNELKQGSKMKWADDVWFNYDLHVTNMTVDDTESQKIVMNVWYPLRTFNLVALYHLQDTMLDGKAQLNWNVRDENKTAELSGRWANPPTQEGNMHNVDLALSHPSFSKDVTLKGLYISTPAVMSNISLELQYSDYENEYLRLKSIIIDNSNGPKRDYQFALKCTHPSTNIDLDMKTDINIHSKWYYFNNYYRYQKSLFYQKLRQNKFLFDLNNNLIQYERSNDSSHYKVNGTWDLTYPDYTFLTNVYRNTGNDTGVAVLSMRDKSLVAHFNSTDDISYHMIGMIVDTRSAKLDAWRDYDDVTTVDLHSYIRLNHSRLVTSSIVWRPTIFGEVKYSAVYALKQLYSQINETLMIVKEAPMEAHLVLRDIWNDAKPRIRDFLDDLNDLHVIKDDLDEFETFLNQSYNHNDFYVKDIVEFTYYVLDEMAIRNHLESLPGIVNDMWGMMGNTSQSIKQSLTYVVDTIKMGYSNFLSSVNRVLEADLMDIVSDRLEAMILQYDNFIRDLHMKFLDYWDSTWVNATNRLSKYWHELLKSMEPLFFKIIHHTEAIVFSFWKNLMDFFYNRTQELTDSPYFNYVSQFGHTVDGLFKDFRKHDLFYVIKKYSAKGINFLWERVEKYIPFKDEVMSLYAEFRSACENFLKTPQVVYVREKYFEAYTRLKWWYDYFLIEDALNRVGTILYDKILDISKTALQYEEIHRTPKTNFIFDPRKGEILLEQKLPMSWHAFNRTPDFSEIGEYKLVKDFLDKYVTNNRSLSIWTFFNELRPYFDINNVMPPFAGMAMMTGQGTLVTFDKRVYTIIEPGTFLLSKDYKQKNFTVLMESNDMGHYNLVVLTKKNLIHIDLYKEQVSLSGSVSLSLPAAVDGFIITRRTNEITVESGNGIEIQCNLMFKTCKLLVSGWYYASLGGLLGTYNNEQYDDMQLPNNTFTTSVNTLGKSWQLAQPPSSQTGIETHNFNNDTQCDKFFENNVSPLHSCFSVINAKPFLEECLSGLDACALANTYMEMCSQEHVPTHIPDQCVQCTTPQGDIIEEGSFYKMDHVVKSTDVIFIVEAHTCNTNLRKNKNIDLFVEVFDTKLQGNGLSDNRYAIVGYGGRGLYNKPRSLYVNNKVFTNAIEISQHFDSFNVDKESQKNRTMKSDIFSALTLATTLPVRSGAPLTVLLMPCTPIASTSANLDYSTIYHNLLENSVTLHILMDGDFILSKKRVNKYLYGIDNSLAYTNKDYERLVGDEALRKQVKVPKGKLGVTASLALETNGCILSGGKLSGGRGEARRFASVAGARVARSALALGDCNRTCECRDSMLACPACNPPIGASFWNPSDVDEIIDNAMDQPITSL